MIMVFDTKFYCINKESNLLMYIEHIYPSGEPSFAMNLGFDFPKMSFTWIVKLEALTIPVAQSPAKIYFSWILNLTM